MLYDLHTHTNFSDGVLTPEDLIHYAKSKNVQALAITDHDTLAALPRAKIAAEKVQIKLINGVEISTAWKQQDIHIVGLNIDVNNVDLQQGLEQQRVNRQLRAIKIGKNLEKYGVMNAYENANNYANGEVGRLHYARYLIELGLAKDVKQAFQKYLKTGKAGVSNSGWVTIAEAIQWIKAANGIAVLAHPLAYRLTATQLKLLCTEFVTAGGEAIEVVSGKQKIEESWQLAGLANRFNLLASMGSDYHETKIGYSEIGQFSALPSSCQPIWKAF